MLEYSKMPHSETTHTEKQDYYMVQIRVYIPNFVADWLSKKAKEDFKTRNIYIRDLFVRLYRRENG